MGERTYGEARKSENAKLTPAEIRQNKCKRSRARNEARKRQAAEAAAERKQYRDSLSPQQQLARLNQRLGKGVGAKKERGRLKALLDN